MTMRSEDQDRLPPMAASVDIAERQRLEDLKEFRRYLVDTSTVKCLVRMYQHAAKHELRIDNPKLVKQFLAGYTDGNPDAEEIRKLGRENATLEEYNSILAEQVEDLEMQVARQQRLNLAKKIWGHLSSSFAEGQVDFSLDDFYVRLCGKEVEPSTKQVLVDLLRPEKYTDMEATAGRVSKEVFCAVVADNGLGADMLTWLEEQLLTRLESGEPGEAPFAKELMKAIVDSELLPHDTFLLADAVKLDPKLVELLEAVMEGPKEPLQTDKAPAEEEAEDEADA